MALLLLNAPETESIKFDQTQVGCNERLHVLSCGAVHLSEPSSLVTGQNSGT